MDIPPLLKTMSVARPPIRILIAEEQHAQRLLIERSLNLLGQFRIGPVSSFAELSQLTQSTALMFDLVIVNNTLTREKGIDAAVFCLRNTCIRNALIYGDEYLLLRDGADTAQWGALTMARFADLPTLTWVLDALRR